jgi:ParB family chromosome partitioning protein
MSADQPRRLGRGLEALISTAKQQRDEPPAVERTRSDLQRLRISEISPNPFQPRRIFTEAELSELEVSLKANGLLQPITVRTRSTGGWELVAGERRLRAASRLGWTEIPALIREFDDRAMLTLALVENLQRANLNPLEEAEGYQRLIEEFGLTQQQVAEVVGKDHTTITNLLRVLTLPAEIKRMVQQGHLSAAHARALLVLKDARRQIELAGEAMTRQLSVRQVEARARELSTGIAASPAKPSAELGHVTTSPLGSKDTVDPGVRRVEEQLRKHLQTDVQIQQLSKDKGVVRISFYGADDLERLMDIVVGRGRSDFD